MGRVNLLVSRARRLVKAYGAVSIRGPVCSDIDPMLRSFLEVEEHVATEDAEEGRASKSHKNDAFDERRSERVVYNGEYRDHDSAGKGFDQHIDIRRG